MQDVDLFQTGTYKMLCGIPIIYRRPLRKSKTYRIACVKVNDYNTVVLYKHTIPISMTCTAIDGMNPLCTCCKHDLRAIRNASCVLAEAERFLDVPRYILPPR